MAHHRNTIFAAFLLIATQAYAAGSTTVGRVPTSETKPPNGLRLGLVRDIEDNPMEPYFAGVRAQGGAPAAWPASLYTNNGLYACSATLIGPNVVLTAAHCLLSGRATLTITSLGSDPVTGTCQRSPEYPKGDLSADYALCLLDRNISASSYETVADDTKHLFHGNHLLGTGFGCHDPRDAGLAFKPSFQIGVMMIAAFPEAPYPDKKNYIVTAKGKDAFVCNGDSGGATYFGSEHGPRIVVAVNSAVEPDDGATGIYHSVLAALGTTAANQFIDLWLKDHPTAQICGRTKMSERICHTIPP